MSFAPIRTVVFRHEVVVQPATDGRAACLCPEAPGVVASLRFIGIRVVLWASVAERTFLEKAGLAMMADAVEASPRTASPEVFVVGTDEAALTTVLKAGGRAAVLGAELPSGAHRVASLSAVLDLVRDEAISARRSGTEFARNSRNLIADFRGLPEESARSEERGFYRPGGIAEILSRASDGDARAAERLRALARGVIAAEEAGMDAREEILDAWSRLIPAKLRDKCFASSISGDALVVLCTTPVARSELKFGERSLITAIRRLPGCSGINRLVFTI